MKDFDLVAEPSVVDITPQTTFSKADFGPNFRWGTATAAFQIEGAVAKDGRGVSIWDTFTHGQGKIKNNHHADLACDFYHRYEADLELLQTLNFDVYRFSLSWSRILPNGKGVVNQAGLDFYHRVIDKCLSLGIEPCITLYHWDLPQTLQDLGGWKNREIITWFSDYVRVCTAAFGQKVKNWIILNEPMAVAGLGYTTGLHAPGLKGIHNFLPVVHHLAMCQAEGGRVVRQTVENARIGTTFSCSHVQPASQSRKDIRAARRADALLNRLFVEPALGLGYPADAFGFLDHIRLFMKPGDAEKLAFDFDFVGVQNYFRVVVKHAYTAPVLWAKEIPAAQRNVPLTDMGWEIAPDGIYEILKQFSQYEGIKEIIVSENGAAFNDTLENGRVADAARTAFFQQYLTQILKAKNEGVNVNGYYVWSFLDNFEWAEGYDARFGLVYVDYETQERTVKDSGKWFAQFLNVCALVER